MCELFKCSGSNRYPSRTTMQWFLLKVRSSGEGHRLNWFLNYTRCTLQVHDIVLAWYFFSMNTNSKEGWESNSKPDPPTRGLWDQNMLWAPLQVPPTCSEAILPKGPGNSVAMLEYCPAQGLWWNTHFTNMHHSNINWKIKCIKGTFQPVSLAQARKWLPRDRFEKEWSKKRRLRYSDFLSRFTPLWYVKFKTGLGHRAQLQDSAGTLGKNFSFALVAHITQETDIFPKGHTVNLVPLGPLEGLGSWGNFLACPLGNSSLAQVCFVLFF